MGVSWTHFMAGLHKSQERLDIGTIDNRAPSVPRMFLDRVAATPGGEAFRYPGNGGWASVTWQQVGDRVTLIAAGLIALGVILRRMGDLVGADAVYREATPVVQAAYGDDHPAAAGRRHAAAPAPTEKRSARVSDGGGIANPRWLRCQSRAMAMV